MKTGIPLLLLLLAAPLAHAETRYVVDKFDVTLRTGQSTTHQIVRMLPSGTPLEVIEENPETGYSHVKTGSGTEGWILTRMLMDQPAARDRLADVQRQLEQARSRNDQARDGLKERTAERDQLAARMRELESERDRVASDLDGVRRVSANALALDQENRELKQRLEAARQAAADLQQENDSLKSRTKQRWFLIGTGVLLLGVLLGLILPRLRPRRRSEWVGGL